MYETVTVMKNNKIERTFKRKVKRWFVAYFHITGFYPINLGINVDFQSPNIELHIPFGFMKIGWVGRSPNYCKKKIKGQMEEWCKERLLKRRTFGWK